MTTLSEPTHEHRVDFDRSLQDYDGRDSTTSDRERSCEAQIAHIRSAIANILSNSILEFGSWMLDTVFNGDVKAALSRRPHQTGSSTRPPRLNATVQRKTSKTRRHMRGRRL